MEDTIKIKCKDCGEEFEIEQSEAQWYKDRGWELPVRCKACRVEAKIRRQARKEKKNG